MKQPRIRDGHKETLKSHHTWMVPLCLRCPHALEWPVIPVPEGVFPAQQLHQHRHVCEFISVCVTESELDYYDSILCVNGM